MRSFQPTTSTAVPTPSLMTFCPKLGINVKFVDPNNPENFAAAITDKTKALFCETVSNPGLDVADLKAIGDIAAANGIPLVVDSTFSTPLPDTSHRTWLRCGRPLTHEMVRWPW